MPCKDPKLHTQLNNGFVTAPFDCGVEQTRELINFASCGQVDPTEDVIRHRMGLPGKVATNPRDWKAAILHPDTLAEFKAAGLEPPKPRLLDGVDFSIAEDDIVKGRYVAAAMWYGDVNQYRPDLSGSSSFNDNHAEGYLGLVKNPGPQHVRLTKAYDSLRDGRGNYPKGPAQYPWWLVKRACGDVMIRTRDAHGNVISQHKLGAGKFLGVTIARSKPLDPVVTPPTDCETQLRQLFQQGQAAVDGLVTVKNWIAQQRTSLDNLEAAVDAAIQQGGGDS